jgi:parallel beta-helix repeat protein
MNKRSIVRSALVFLAALILSLSAEAQLFRAYVAPSPAGNDANPCTLPLPCRLLPAALAVVADGGEIWMLDSANYNTTTVNVTKSVTILAVPGALGSVVANGGPAISVATPGVKLALRNLVIVPLAGGSGTHGILMTDGAALIVENCLIAGIPQVGIRVTAMAYVRIVDSVIRDGLSHGIELQGSATASISGSKLLGHAGGVGVYAHGATVTSITTAVVSDSIVSGNFWGIEAVATPAGATVNVSVTRSTVSNNTWGIVSDSSAFVTVSNNLVTSNWLYGLAQSNAGKLESLGNNLVRQNGTNVLGTITPLTGL